MKCEGNERCFARNPKRVEQFLLSCNPIKNSQKDSSKPFVILKLDDLWCEQEVVHAGWIQVVDFLNAQKVKGKKDYPYE